MQEPGRRATPPFPGVDLRRPKGYAVPAPAPVEAEAEGGDPCPRCASRDTKFCYYNNYNTSQPRHFCKACRRYWTKGGSLRNVPVGGASRKGSASPPAKRRRVVSPAPDPQQLQPPSCTDAASAGAVADVAPTESSTKLAADDVAPMESSTKKATTDDDLAAPDGGCTDTSVAAGVGLGDAGEKQLSDSSQFEWPSGYDMGPYWATGVFADADPSLFLNLP